MPNSIPSEVTEDIEKQIIQLLDTPTPLSGTSLVRYLMRTAAQFGYALGKAESNREEHLKPQNI